MKYFNFIHCIENFQNIMVDNKFLPKLSKNLLEILDDEEYYNITILKLVKIFRLNYGSPYFRKKNFINE